MPRELRQFYNRELFRAVNDQIAGLASKLSLESDAKLFVCECTSLGCTAQIAVPLAVYGEVREMPGAYLVLEGHEDASLEETIAEHGTYRIVIAQSDDQSDPHGDG